jgi:hypothetical protein
MNMVDSRKPHDVFAGGLEAHQQCVCASPAYRAVYDPNSGQFTPTGSLQSPRYRHTTTLPVTGEVLVTGKANATGSLSTAEWYQ